MTTEELTTYLNEDADARREAKTLANISRRAATLLDDGYTVTAYAKGWSKNLSDRLYRAEIAAMFMVTSPAGMRYLVWHGEGVGYSCQCPCFAKRNTCKHLEGVDLIKKDAAQCAEYEARESNDDDRYPEF